MLHREITLHKSSLFACLDLDLHLERVAGGNESEVYRTDDGRFAVKLKNEPHPTVAAALQEAKQLRAAADNFSHIVGPEHSVPISFVIASDDSDHVYVLIVMPYLNESPPLFYLDYAALSRNQRRQIADQLQGIIRRSFSSYWQTGIIPDIYGDRKSVV